VLKKRIQETLYSTTEGGQTYLIDELRLASLALDLVLGERGLVMEATGSRYLPAAP
jgi:hypothetical protein